MHNLKVGGKYTNHRTLRVKSPVIRRSLIEATDKYGSKKVMHNGVFQDPTARTVFWYMTCIRICLQNLHRGVGGRIRFGGTFYLYLHGRKTISAGARENQATSYRNLNPIRKIEAVLYSKRRLPNYTE
jgi:hypothetical protein